MDKLRLDYFIKEDLPIYQHPDHFHFNTDTKLLAQFIKLKKQERVLDIGTNNGALLLACDQYDVKELVGVEVLKESSLVAKRNCDEFIKHSCRIEQCPIQEYEDELFDVIISNPPYFKEDASNPETKMTLRQMGRIEKNLTLHELVFHANRLCKSYGRFYFVHRPNRLNDIIRELHAHQFQIKTLQIAYDSRTKSEKSILIEAIKESNCDCKILEPIWI